MVLPFALLKAGFLPGLLLLLGLAWLVDWTVSTLILVSKLASAPTYQGLVRHCFGRVGFYLVSAFQLLFAFGAMTAYTVIIGDTLPLFLRSVLPPSWPLALSSRPLAIVLASGGVSLPLSLSRDIAALSKTSAVSVLAILFIAVAMALTPVEAGERGNMDAQALLGFHFTGLTQSIGVIAFAFVW